MRKGLWLRCWGGQPVWLGRLLCLGGLSAVVVSGRAGRRGVLGGAGAVGRRRAGLRLLHLLGGGRRPVAAGLVAAGLSWVLLGRAAGGLVTGVPRGAGVAPILPVVPVLAVLGVVIVLPQVLVGGLIVVVVGVLNRGSLLRGRVATVVPDPLRPCLPGLIKPVCLLLTQMIGFGNQKQTTVNLSLEAARVEAMQ